jgi:hypothetical protein
MEEKNFDSIPEPSELKKIPLWIKIMWIAALIFIVSYVYNGLSQI